MLKKKKLLNVKYKRKSDSLRLLDKQFSVTDSNQFKINIKGTNYFFKKIGKNGQYDVYGDEKKVRSINIGSSLRMKHKDGTDIYFDLYEDFLYALDYGMYAYVAFSVFLNLAIAMMLPTGSDSSSPVAEVKEEKESEKRVEKLLKKLSEEKKIVVKATTTTLAPTTTTRPKPKVAEKPKPKPKRKIQPQKKPKKRSNLLSEKKSKRPSPNKTKGTVKVVNDKRPMKRLVVEKGPPKRGGTGPRNPNAKGNTAARAQAKRLAQTKAKVANSLNFLTKGKGDFNIPPGGKGGRGFAVGGGKGLAGAKNVKGTNFLAKVTGKNVLGSSSGAINTKGSRTVASGRVLSNGEINGIEGGRSYNYVQGKVSVSGLHAAGGSGGGLSHLGPQSMSVKGGKMSQSLIRKIIAKHMSKFTYCYEKSLLSNPNLAGIVNISWKIAPGGRVSGTRIVKSQLNNQKLHGCLTGVLNKISFAPGPKGGPATVVYPFNFTASML